MVSLGRIWPFLVSLALTFLVPAYRQLALIERIEAGGGKVKTEPVGPEWVRNLLGEEMMRGFDDVVDVWPIRFG